MMHVEPTDSPIVLELIPASMWGKNVRAIISRDNWAALRWSFGATRQPPSFLEADIPHPDYQAGIECHICGAREDNLELHEQWEYDDENLVQKLTGMISICENCHLAIHMGCANKLGLADKAREHMAKVNNWSSSQVNAHVREAFERWMVRSDKEYKLDVSWLTQFVPESKIHLDWLENPKRLAWNRLDAISWAKKVMLNSDAVIVDTETTGLLTYPKVEVIEIAIINMKGKVVYRSRFRPRYKIPNSDIHGITDEDVKKEPSFEEEYKNIIESLHSKNVIAYNAEFDQGVINRTCELYDLNPPECQWECAMRVYRGFQETGRWSSLPYGKHNALDDCKAVLKLIRRMAEGKRIDG